MKGRREGETAGMQTENKNLKRSFILQSFAPLFLLLTIKHLDIDLYWRLVFKFFRTYSEKGVSVFLDAIHHPLFGSFIVSIMGICWLILTIAVALGFQGIQKAGFKDMGETIIIEETPNDSGATFLMTYILPLLTDDVKSLRGLMVFITMLIMVILLLEGSKSFYQNPVLAAMRYKTFSFKFRNPGSDISDPDKLYIGITRGTLTNKVTIKRKHISDGVFVIYNNIQGEEHNYG